MRFISKHLEETGDTLVEVLIAIAIISTVLAGAFTVSQQSAKAVRNSQEHGEALQILQGQVELVRALAFTEADMASGVYTTSPKYFCIDSTAVPPIRVPMSQLNSPNDDESKYEPQCIQGLYDLAVSYDATAGTQLFTFYATWDRLGGGQNQEQLVYRVYPSK